MGAQFQHSPGQLVNLLRVAVADEVDMGTRQAAAISFKNLVRKDWEGTGVCSHGCWAHAPAHGCARCVTTVQCSRAVHAVKRLWCCPRRLQAGRYDS